MAPRLLLAVSLLASPASAGEPPAPGALSGRFVDAAGTVLEVGNAKGALTARIGGGGKSAARWTGAALVVDGERGGTEYAAGADEGRLTLSDGKKIFAREGTSPWWRLKPATRAELSPRLKYSEGRAWILPGFTAWYAATYAGTPVKETPAMAEWTFDGLDAKQRLSLLALTAKLMRESAWRFVGPVVNVGGSGELDFLPAVSQDELRSGLAKLGFVDAYGASKGAPWGVRDGKPGAQLHFRGVAPVNVHLDFYNPTTADEAALHVYHDLQRWSEEHTAARVAAEVRDQGIAVEFSPD